MRTFPLLALLLPGTALGQYGAGTQFSPEQAFAPPELKQIGVDQRLGDRVETEARVTTEEGKTVRFGDLLGKRPVILLPIFYRCTGVCNLELTGVTEALKAMPGVRVGRDVDVIALGLNPKETYELGRAKEALTLRQYGQPETAPGWHFLTGSQEEVSRVTRSLGFRYLYDAGKDRVSHPTGVMVLTPKGIASAYVLSATFKPDRLGHFLDVARKEEVGQKTQEIFFGCIHIDPVTGKRSFVIENILRVFGMATLLTLVTSLLVLSGRMRLRRRMA